VPISFFISVLPSDSSRRSARLSSVSRRLRRLGQFGHAVGVEGLFQKVEGPDPHRLDRHRHIAMPGDHDHRQAGIHAHQRLRKAIPSMPGILMSLITTPGNRPEHLQRLFGAGKGFGVEPRQRQPLADRLRACLPRHRRSPPSSHVPWPPHSAAFYFLSFQDRGSCTSKTAPAFGIARRQPAAKVGHDPRRNRKPQPHPSPGFLVV
jgi:hypothetical protein